MRTDFILIGAQKSGTTSLAAQLAAHPEICFSSTKEPAYFNEVEDWRAGLDEYHKLYTPEPGQLCGEASTMYTFFPEWKNTHKRLYEYNPDLKLIYMMRQPVSRIISHYTHNLVRNIDNREPETAVLNDPRYLYRSRYAVQIRPYIELFGRQNILLLIFEEYAADQTASLHTVADFLGINKESFSEADMSPKHQSVGTPYLKYPLIKKMVGTEFFQSLRGYIPASIRQPVRHRFFSNRLDEKPQFSPELRTILWQLLADDVQSIEKFIGRQLDIWCEENIG